MVPVYVHTCTYIRTCICMRAWVRVNVGRYIRGWRRDNRGDGIVWTAKWKEICYMYMKGNSRGY